MTDEYRAFLESRKSGESDHQEIPHWKPSKRKEEKQEASSFLEHYGVPGMKWGIINEDRDAEINKKRGKLAEAGHKILSALGNDKAQQADAEKAAADRGIREADRISKRFSESLEAYSDPNVKAYIAEEHLWEMRGGMDPDVIAKYKNGDPEATEQLYRAAKMFDNLMNQYAENSGTTLENDKVIEAMALDSQELEDLYNELKEKGVKYPEQDPDYAKKYKEVHDNLDGYADHVAGILGMTTTDEKAYQRIKDDLKVLWFKTGYTNLNGYDNSDWTQYGEANKRREQRKKDKDAGIMHSEFEEIELPYLEHSGIKGMKWHVRRWQYLDGTLTPAGVLRYRKNGNGESKKTGDPEEDKPKKEKYNSKTLTYRAKPQHLTDEELDRRNRRMQKEAQYNQLRSQLQPKTKAERRKELRRTIFVATATTAAAAIMTQIYKKAAVWMVNKASGGKINLGGKKS